MKQVFLCILMLCGLAQSAFAAVEIQEVESKSGIKAWLVEEHQIPFVALEIAFKGGTSLDLAGKRGATGFMMALLEEGAGDLDAQGFANARDDVSAQFVFDAGADFATISVQMLTDERAKSVALLKTALMSPRFDEAAIDRVRGQIQSIIVSNAKDPSTIARHKFAKAAFGDHPYGSSDMGTAASIDAITHADLHAAHLATLTRDRMFVSAVGDITKEELSILLDNLLGDLPAKGAPLPHRADYGLMAGTDVTAFPTPQSVVQFGHLGLKRDDPDFFAAYLVNEVFGGGGFDSRLMNEVREKRGLTYGISSYLIPRTHSEMIVGSFSSSNDRVKEAIEVVKGEWAKIAENGITAEELSTTKTYLTGAYPLRFDGNARIADILVGMQAQGLSPNYVRTRNAKIEAITLEDANRVARRIYDSKALHFTVVGMPDGLTKPES
ncbi:MAG: M16 family metallopeptidase [Halocynthiibacter sp.]